MLDWAQHLAVEDEDKRQILPGKNDAVTKNQFLSFLRDGTLLAKLANRLQPGSIETVHDGEAAKEKTNQESNINAFINFAKEKAGLSDEQVRGFLQKKFRQFFNKNVYASWVQILCCY